MMGLVYPVPIAPNTDLQTMTMYMLDKTFRNEFNDLALTYMMGLWDNTLWTVDPEVHITGASRATASAADFRACYMSCPRASCIRVFCDMYVGHYSNYVADTLINTTTNSVWDNLLGLLGNFYNYMTFPFHYGSTPAYGQFYLAVLSCLKNLGIIAIPNGTGVAAPTYTAFLGLLPQSLQDALKR
jgi:hypothetical protein